MLSLYTFGQLLNMSELFSYPSSLFRSIISQRKIWEKLPDSTTLVNWILVTFSDEGCPFFHFSVLVETLPWASGRGPLTASTLRTPLKLWECVVPVGALFALFPSEAYPSLKALLYPAWVCCNHPQMGCCNFAIHSNVNNSHKMNGLHLQWLWTRGYASFSSQKSELYNRMCTLFGFLSPCWNSVFGEMVIVCGMNYLVDVLLPRSLPVLFFLALCLAYEKQTNQHSLGNHLRLFLFLCFVFLHMSIIQLCLQPWDHWLWCKGPAAISTKGEE